MIVLAIIFFGFASPLFIMGVFFKIQHWPGATLPLLAGIVLALIGCLFYVLSRFKNKNKLDNILDLREK